MTQDEMNFSSNIADVEEERKIEDSIMSSMKPMCRICLGSSISSTDYLLSPCECKGSLTYVHLSCIKSWIRNKISYTDENNVITFQGSSLVCELCRFVYPIDFLVDNGVCIGNSMMGSLDTSNIRSFGKKNNPYLIVEIEYRSHNKREITFLNFANKKKFKIGRSDDVDVLLKDVSISRNHAHIIFRDGEFLLFDYESKFGSYLKCENEIEYDDGSCFAYENMIFRINKKKKNSKFLSCFGLLLQ